ncbi:hypothetical protein HKBW3S43_00526 [Candidatus Hakubella thermalkaliphila]|uniref:Uncharacterized protein n=1 Tax=Candidatus Hakubella thermalkaliphila TaxID=2754717 RepID=A0A6V8PSE6_9ACTN|nr:hypothetical protein [Candidatus Hakubella thermalkaliphila]GFP25312.1 hypothetical protein HKBW3S25_00784 [Candidatus Hakubella thermalkaliphila]GFP27283.1 hypothetical protein HKBW3S33_00697 [Candidatus Hakubella thermalkaliphila]GFP34734.1 hypothetical protein HKBW3S43_00526 [Candidatus Hakubella thermalkaliphila]
MNQALFQIFIPLNYNDGTSVEKEKIQKTCTEIGLHFGGYTLHETPVRGGWYHEGRLYHDQHLTLMVIADDNAQNRTWLKNYKPILKNRFCQIEIFILVWEIEIL